MHRAKRERDPQHQDEGALLLREAAHRAMNDLSVALSGLRIAIATDGIDDRRRELLGSAVRRIEASAVVHRLLSRPLSERMDVGAWLDDLCQAFTGTSADPEPPVLTTDIGEVWLDGEAARRLVMVAAELMTNAFRYAVTGRESRVTVSLRADGAAATLRVGDDGPGITAGASRPGGGLGGGIVADLVRFGGGEMTIDTGPSGTAIAVSMPSEDGMLREGRSFDESASMSADRGNGMAAARLAAD